MYYDKLIFRLNNQFNRMLPQLSQWAQLTQELAMPENIKKQVECQLTAWYSEKNIPKRLGYINRVYRLTAYLDKIPPRDSIQSKLLASRRRCIADLEQSVLVFNATASQYNRKLSYAAEANVARLLNYSEYPLLEIMEIDADANKC